MANRTTNIKKGGKPTLNVYELNEDIFNDNKIKILKFDKPSKEWANFIINNRNRKFKNIKSKRCNTDNKYNLVIGPVADDDIIMLFRTFESGLIDIDTLIKELTDQYSFHTEAALKYLKGV